MNVLMKKFLSVCVLFAVLLCGFTVMAGTKGLFLSYYTSGSAKYADGTDILEGEWFVLVWTQPGVTIDLSKDITGDVNSFLGDGSWGWISKKPSSGGKVEGGSVMTADAKYSSGGSVQLYLLDTRISSTELAPLGTNTNGKQFPTVVNAVVPIEGATYTWTAFDAMYHTVSGSAPETTAWTLLTKATPVPVIVSCVFTNGVFTVGATNTIATKSYVLNLVDSAGFTNVIKAVDTKTGLSDPLAALTFDDANATNSAAFYRVEVVK